MIAAALVLAMVVTDDPFKPYAEASIRSPIAAVTGGWSGGYCHTGGFYEIRSSLNRSTGNVIYVLSAVVDTLRSNGSVTAIDLLGGLPLENEHREVANFACFASGCHNDAALTYTIPASTLGAIRKAGSVPIRISTTGGPSCAISGEVSASELDALDAWAKGLRSPGFSDQSAAGQRPPS